MSTKDKNTHMQGHVTLLQIVSSTTVKSIALNAQTAESVSLAPKVRR